MTNKNDNKKLSDFERAIKKLVTTPQKTEGKKIIPRDKPQKKSPKK